MQPGFRGKESPHFLLGWWRQAIMTEGGILPELTTQGYLETQANTQAWIFL